eukprot:6177943-Pleurochrysis_carterae.AAC.3
MPSFKTLFGAAAIDWEGVSISVRPIKSADMQATTDEAMYHVPVFALRLELLPQRPGPAARLRADRGLERSWRRRRKGPADAGARRHVGSLPRLHQGGGA